MLLGIKVNYLQISFLPSSKPFRLRDDSSYLHLDWIWVSSLCKECLPQAWIASQESGAQSKEEIQEKYPEIEAN